MPELIAKGPIIPIELMNRLDDGRVVFFCGAGISMGTGLPSFGQLVDDVYARTGLTKTILETELLKKAQLDKVLGLMEERLPPGQLRLAVIERLSEKTKRGSLDLHKSLFALGRTPEGLRLITTNFDTRFESAGVKAAFIDAAPKLPVPKPLDWHSLVHLHGRISPGERGKNLVLTAADFGRAYLTERWASRFITELFREFTVVFVGYSLDDPVMGYMVDALAAERERGARFSDAYAFAAYDTAADRDKTEFAWRGKKVKPLLYHAIDKHRLLVETLAEWANIRRDPYQARSRIAQNAISILPTGPNDPDAERVTWALQDATAAKALATSPVITAEADYPKIIAWLDIFDAAGLLSRTGPLLHDYQSLTQVAGYWPITRLPPQLDAVSAHLANWIARHIHVPQVLAWVLKKGGYVHPHLATAIREKLAKPEASISEKLRLFWTLLIDKPVPDEYAELWIEETLAKAGPQERDVILRAYFDRMRPRLTVKPGPSSDIGFRRAVNPDTPEATELDRCGHLALVVNVGKFGRHSVKHFDKPEMLARYAGELTSHLERAVELLPYNDEGYTSAHFYRPSISEHEQNRKQDDWTILIDLVRDSYVGLAAQDRRAADLLLIRWASHDNELFKRVVLHAITEDANADVSVAVNLLLADNASALWYVEPDREVLRFLRKAGQRLRVPQVLALVAAIKAGPLNIPEDYLPFYSDERIRQREIGKRLKKLQSSGVPLDDESAAIAAATVTRLPDEPEDRDEFGVWSGGARWVGREESATRDQLDLTAEELAAAIHAKSFNNEKYTEEQFEDLALQQLDKAKDALDLLAKSGEWPGLYWQRLFWAVASLRNQQKLKPEQIDHLSAILLGAPTQLYIDAGSTLADFLEELAKLHPIDQEPLIAKLWLNAWAGVDTASDVGIDDPLTQALNSAAGKLGEAAGQRLWKRNPEAGKGIPSDIKPYFERIGADHRGHYARVMLAVHLNNFYLVDPEWTTHAFLERMKDPTHPEARDLWAAYAWSPRMGPNLLAALKASLLTVLKHYGDEKYGRQQENLIYLFLSISLDAPDGLTRQEVKSVMDILPQEGLAKIAYGLEHRLNGTSEENAETWKTRVGPWLKQFWPQANDHNTSETSAALVELLLKAGPAYPAAVAWVLPFLKPMGQHDLFRIEHSKIFATYPLQTFAVLKQVIPAEGIAQWEKGILKNILDGIAEKAPDIMSDPDFIRLYRVATT